jgi:chemotaxis protein MotB|tara:strand:- start:5049 stop:6011 length:963 start_codon:yes stop_codon:yes gene_type:complete
MKNSLLILIFGVILFACVPAKKYNDLLEKEKICAGELEKYKNSSINFEGKAADLQSKYAVMTKEVASLRADTTKLGQDFRLLQVEYNKMTTQNQALEKMFDNYRKSGEKTTASLQLDLEAKNLELQRKQEVLSTLEKDLAQKEALLAEREARVNELEEAIARKDKAQTELKTRVQKALIGFENKGLTVVQKNGKIYVSLEAKLLFASGSTTVESEGKKALIELAKVLQNEKDLEIIVEGHTDTDKLTSATSPKNNWELSVLRATSVVEIMLASSSMDPKKLMPAGRSQYLPVDPNDKAKNRRIEIIISPNLNELFDIISK